MTRVKVMMTCREVMITLFDKTRYLHQHTLTTDTLLSAHNTDERHDDSYGGHDDSYEGHDDL